MPNMFRLPVAAAFGLAALALSLPAFATPTIITVSLNNQAISTDLPNNLGMAMPGADKSKDVMTVTAVPNVVPAGEISLAASNRSADFTHEMILVKVTSPTSPLPYVAGDGRSTRTPPATSARCQNWIRANPEL